MSVLHSKEEKEGFWAWFGAYWKGLWRYIFAKGIRNRMAIGCVLFFLSLLQEWGTFLPSFPIEGVFVGLSADLSKHFDLSTLLALPPASPASA